MTRDRLATSMLALLLCTTPLAGQRCRSPDLRSASQPPVACAPGCAACGPNSTRRVIDAAGIAAYGWHRVGDIVGALPPGSAASVDGFNYSLTGSRIGFMEASGSSASWIVRLDGQFMPVSVGGLVIFDAIPVAIVQIDSIVITDGPLIVDGRTTFLGTIDLFTRRARTGPSVVGDYQHGDESGDPGPYRYTPRATPNVEKIGPFASGALAYGTGSSAFDFGARYSSTNITDQRIASQFPGTFGGLQSDVNASGGSGVVTLHGAGGDHFIIGGRGRFTGLMRFPADASSQSGRVVATQFGASGNAVMSALTLRYAATATKLEIDPLGTALPFLVEGDRTIGDAFVEASPRPGKFNFGAGVNAGHQTIRLSTNERHTERAWATYADTRETATVALEHAAGGFRIGGSIRHVASLPDSDRLAVTLTAFTSSADANNAWMDGPAFGTSDSPGASTGMADLRIELTTRDMLRMMPTWYGRAFSVSGRDGQPDVQAVAAGVVATAAAGHRATGWIHGEVSQLLGNMSVGESTTPGGFIEAIGSIIAPGRFLLSLSGRYAPKTTWPDFTAGLPDVPAIQRVDFSVNKPMWNDHMRMQLVMRNALNAADRTHPVGAQWNLRTHLAVTIDLPPLPRGTP